MGRLLARSDADQEMHAHLAASIRALRQALAVAGRTSKGGHPVVARRAKDIVRRLRGALSILEGIGTTQPLWDMEDPDMIPEDEKPTVVPAAAQVLGTARYLADEGEG